MCCGAQSRVPGGEMKKQDLAAKTLSELRSLARDKGIQALRTWKKEDFIKALSAKTSSAKKTAKPAHTAKPLRKKRATAPPPQKRSPAKAAQKAAKKKVEKKPAKKSPGKPALKAAQKAAPPKREKKPKKPLDALTVAELKALAKELAVPLTAGAKKADIIKALKTAERAPAAKKAALEKPAPAARKKTAAPKAKKAAPLRKRVKAVVAKTPKSPASPVKKKRAVAPQHPQSKEPLFKELPKLLEKPEEPTALEPGREDRIVTMTVAPRRLYVYWEVAEATVMRHPGNLNLKISDLKGGETFYLPIDERVGEYFITVAPDTEYSAEVGVIDRAGKFVTMIPLQKSRPSIAITPPETRAEPPRRKPAVKAVREPAPQQPPLLKATGPEGAALPSCSAADAIAELLAAVGAAAGFPDEVPFAVEAALQTLPSQAFWPREPGAAEEGLPEEFFILPDSVSSY